ncbi:hypothetical protein ACN47E_004344 [Coniothyrium glycines]
MSHLQYFDYAGFGERSKRELNYSQCVRVDNRIEVSGQGGWDRITETFPEDLAKEVDQAFDNVGYAVKQAGGTGWEQIYKLRIYITVSMDEVFEPLVRNLKARFPNHGPIMTVVQVKGLYSIMRLEIEAEAHLG